MTEPLDRRTLLSTTLAVIGDYSAGQGAADVANLVGQWNPSAIVTVGDNNYPAGSSATIDQNIGRYYHSYIAPYKGSFGTGAADGVNHFWPTLGDHDWLTDKAKPYLSYFSLPGNGRYYSAQVGNVGIFVLDSNAPEPDGNTAGSVQGQWLQHVLSQSTAQWKLVFCFHPPYSSGANGDNSFMQWPFQQWGANGVFSGHDHDYERLTENGLTYFVDGLGGESTIGFNAPIRGSQVRFADDFGAIRIDADGNGLRARFVTRGGIVVDDYTIGGNTPPAPPTALLAQALGSTQIGLKWTDPTNDETGFTIERSSDGIHFGPIGQVPVGVNTYADQGLSPGATYTYRVRATGLAGTSDPSNVATLQTPTAATGVTFLSDLSWASASNDFGPVRRDLSNGGPKPDDGRTITLSGVPYIKGLGVHANSSVIYGLNGQYSRFLADVGVDDEETIHGAADFQVFADGKQIYDSGILTFSSPTQSVSLDITGVNQLDLVVRPGGDTIDYDHADWANARVASSSAIPPAPAALSVAQVSDTSVNLSWSDDSGGTEGFKIERSSDGVHFVTVATLDPGATSYTDANIAPLQSYDYRIRSTGLAGDSDPSAAVQVSIPPTGFAFPHGIVGLSGISLGPGTITDSYDSSAGSYSPAQAGTDGSIASLGKIRLGKGAIVHGSAAGASVTAGTITGTRGRPARPPSYTPLSAPASNDNKLAGDSFRRGDYRLSARQNGSLGAGTFVFRNLQLAAGASLQVTGPTIIYITRALSLGTGAQLLASRPQDLRIVLLGSARATFGKASNTSADLYGPRSKVTMASAVSYFGSLISARLTTGAHTALHYDDAFGDPKWTMVPFSAPAKKQK